MPLPRLRHSGEPQAPWGTGWAEYWIEKAAAPSDHVLVIAARCRIEGVGGIELALVDTGAQWSLIGGELAELAKPYAQDMDCSIAVGTRLGQIQGAFHRLDIVLVADEGEDLVVSSTVLLAPAWSGPPIVLGYRGLLERVRLGFDPGIRDDDQWVCFGGL